DLTTIAGILAVYPPNLPTPSHLEPLTGGNANFVWRAHLTQPLPSGSKTLIIKHAEPFVAKFRQHPFRVERQLFEVNVRKQFRDGEFAEILRKCPGIKIPELYHFDQDNWILYMEDAGTSTTLKEYLSTADETKIDEEKLRNLGEKLGNFLRRLHEVGVGSKGKLLGANPEAKAIINACVYKMVGPLVEQVQLSCPESVKTVESFGDRDVAYSEQTLTMGDFWPGNLMVSSSSCDPDATEIWILDWEATRYSLAALDAAQFCAELFFVYHFRSKLALHVLNAFLREYRKGGSVDEHFLKCFGVGFGAHVVVWSRLAGWSTDESMLRSCAVVGIGMVDNGSDREYVANGLMKALVE
ncbi:kinase-like domain-containing protein, partial [Powellomyces hirtus]